MAAKAEEEEGWGRAKQEGRHPEKSIKAERGDLQATGPWG